MRSHSRPAQKVAVGGYLDLCDPGKRARILALAAAARQRAERVAVSGSSNKEQTKQDSSAANGEKGDEHNAISPKLTIQGREHQLEMQALQDAVEEACGAVDEERRQLHAAERHNATLCKLLAACSAEAEQWRPEAAAAWLQRMRNLVAPNGAETNAANDEDCAGLELGGCLACPSTADAKTRRLTQERRRLQDYVERLRAQNNRLRQRCAESEGTHVPEETREAIALCRQTASSCARRAEELRAERDHLEAALAACLKTCVQLEQRLLTGHRQVVTAQRSMQRTASASSHRASSAIQRSSRRSYSATRRTPKAEGSAADLSTTFEERHVAISETLASEDVLLSFHTEGASSVAAPW